MYIRCLLTHIAKVVTKITKHAREAPSTTAHGLLLGLDLDGVLEVSNSFPLPTYSGDDDEKTAKSTGESSFKSCPKGKILTEDFQHDNKRPCCVL